MNITKEQIDDLNAQLKVKVDKEDYDERVQNILRDYRKKANIPGFRPGKVPMGMINKMYRKPVLVEEINKIVSESLNHYFKEENVKILGEPLPNKEQQPEINWDINEEFEFIFDIGMAPEFDVTFTKKDKVPYYIISIDDGLRQKYIDKYTRQFGSYQEIEEVQEMNEILSGNLVNVDEEGNEQENGIEVNDTKLSVEIIKDEDIKKQFKGVKPDQDITFNIKKAYPNDTEIAGLLQMEKEKVQDINPFFKFLIKEISVFKNAEINQDLFDKVYGKDVVKTEDEFHEKIDEEIADNLQNESEYRFTIDIRNAMINKINMDLPVDFLKRWMKETSEKEITDEQIEQQFEGFEKDLKWQLIKNEIAKKQDIKIEKEDVIQKAREYIMMQYRQYGLTNIPNEQLDPYVNQVLQNEQEARRLTDKAIEDKVIENIRQEIKIEEKKVSVDDFNKLFEE